MRAEAEERVSLVLESRRVRTGCLRNIYTGHVRAAELLAFFDSVLVSFPHRDFASSNAEFQHAMQYANCECGR